MDDLTKRVKRNFKNKIKGSSKGLTTPKTQQEKLQDQLENYKTRLINTGVDPEEVTDDRNWLEKALNLEKDQNVLFDIFEILDRPRNALFTGIKSVQEGKSLGEGLKKGISGEEETSGGQLIRNMGIDSKGINGNDKAGLNPLSWGIDDVLGFGLDMFADPMSWLTLPAKGAGVAGKAAKAVDAVNDAQKALDIAKLANNAADIAKAQKTLDIAKQSAKVANEALEKASKSIFYNAGKAYTTGDNIVGRVAGKTIKVGAKAADKVIESSLKGIDNMNAKKIAKLVDKGLTESEAIAKLNINPNKVGLYRDLKKGAKNIVDSSSAAEGFVGRSRSYDSEKDFMNLIGEQSLDEIKKNADNIAKSMGISTDELMSKVVNAIESNKDWSLKGQDVIARFKESKYADFLTPKQASDVKNALDSFGIKSTLDKNGRVLHLDENNLSKLYTIQDAPIGDTIFKDAVFGSKNYDEVNELLKADREFFNQSPELQNLYNKMENAVKEYATVTSDSSKGLNAGNAATTDYVKHSRTDEALKRMNDKEFKSREASMDASIAQVNKMQEEERLTKLASEEAALDRNLKSIYKTEIDDAGNEILLKDKDGNFIRDDNKYKELVNRKQNLVNTLEKSIASNEEVLRYAKETDINKVANNALLNKKGEKAISQIDRLAASTSEIDVISKEISEHLKEVKAMKDVTPDGLEALNNLTKTYNEFSKRYTDLKNTIPKMTNKIEKGTLDELGGYLTANEQIKHTFEPLTFLRDKVRSELTISKATVDDTFKKGIREQLKIYKKGQELGEKLTKKTANVKSDLKKIELIKKSTADGIINLNRKLNFQKQALENLGKSSVKDDIYKKTLESIKHHTEQIELLKSQEGQAFFKTKFDEIFPDYVKAASTQNAGTKKFYDALANNLFDNEEYIRLYDGESIPYGYTKMNGNNLIRKFDSYKAIMTDEGKELGETLNKFKDKSIIIDKQFATALDVASKTNKQQVAPLLKVWDGINNVFKKFSTLTSGFHVRNFFGNSTNMALSGMNPAAMPEYWTKAKNLWNNADDLIRKARQGILSVDEAKQFDILKQFYQGGFADALKKGYGLEDVSKAVNASTKNPINKVSKFSMDVNNTVDSYNRLALLMYANDNPKYLQRLGKDNAIDAVKYVLFDPNNLSDTEKAMKRIIPFYTFTKQNLYFQASNLMKNTGRYKALYRGLERAYDSIGEESYYDYQKQGMQIPLPFQDDEGNQLFLKANLPVSDLGEFLENPVQRIVSSTSPLIKTPFEMTTGKDTFTGQDLNLNTLSGLTDKITDKVTDKIKITDKLGIDGGGARNTAQLAEHILKNFGLSNVSTNLIKKVQAILENSEGDKSSQQLWAEIFRSVLQSTNSENVKMSGLYDELEAYQAEVKRLKNQGIDVPTIKEITASNKLKLNNLKNKRASLR